jgi:type 1 fimbria pilin
MSSIHGSKKEGATMKRTLTALAGLAMMAGTASAIPADSDDLKINLKGTVDSVCELTPDGPLDYDVNMLDYGNQGLLAIAYSCNSPYTVTIASKNGGMEHQESTGAVNIPYDIETYGFFVSATFDSAAIAGTPGVLDTDNDWTNILLNGDGRIGNMDLRWQGLSNFAVAGTYKDTLTIKIKADL